MGGLVYGYCTGIIAGASPAIADDWKNIDDTKSGLITASIVFGAAIGSLTGGLIADKIGRQKASILMSFGAVVMSVFQAACPFLTLLLITRLILGFFLGLISVVCPLYVSEAAPSDHRGTLGSFFQVSITFGIFLAYVLGYVLQPSWVGSSYLSWKMMIGLGAVPSIGLLYLSLFAMHESPLWLASQIGVSDRPILKGSETLSTSGPFSSNPGSNGWRGLFSKACLLPLSIGIILAFDLQGTGINGIVFYLPKLLDTAGLGNLAQILTIVIGFWNFVSTFAAVFLVDRAGRKPLLLIGTAIMAVSLFFIGLAFYVLVGKTRGWFAFAFIALFHTGFEIGPGVLFWIVIAEIFPTGVRSEANGFINLLNNLLNLLVSFLFPIIFAKAQGAIFFVFAVFAILALVYILFTYKETKDESPLRLGTIQDEPLQ